MAALSKNGTEVAGLSRQFTRTDGSTYIKKYSVRSNGAVLSNCNGGGWKLVISPSLARKQYKAKGETVEDFQLSTVASLRRRGYA